MKPTIMTSTGAYFRFDAPEQSPILIQDIAHALSNICRFTGHVKTFYSVAQHSVLVSRIVARQFQFQALLHDASEAYLGDVSSPLKQMLSEYKIIERRVEDAIYARFGISPTEESNKAIKKADIILLGTEKRDLMYSETLESEKETWELLLNVPRLLETIEPWSPAVAEEEFMKRFDELRSRAQ